jgi:hypothetical protein
VQPAEPVFFDLLEGAQRAGALEGSSPHGVVKDGRFTVGGPFAPGSTFVQVGYSLPIATGSMTIQQKLPVALAHLSVLAQKTGGVQLESSQIAEHRDMPLQGEMFIFATRPGLKAGETLSLTFSCLPHQPVWPRNLALVLAALILAAGAWGSTRTSTSSPAQAERRRRLEARRDRLFAELTSIEEQHRQNTIDPERYATRRRDLIEALERVYAEMDEEAAA